MRRSARQLGNAPVAPVGREGAATRASSSHSMADDEADPRMDDDECPAADGSFSTRFSATRLRRIADRLPQKKKDVIRLCSFGSLLNINSFSVPTDLLDWVVMKIDPEKSLFSHRQKSILFTKDMVRKIFNVTSGSRAVELLRRNEPHVLREPYRVGSRAPTRRTIEVLEVADVLDVVTIKRAWVLLCIALVLSPGTGNMVPLEYLASLVDMDSINEFAWDEHFLAVALNEVKKYQKKRNEGKSAFWIGGCLPMFAIIYMDFVEVPHLMSCEHRIDYSLPRSCFVCNDDFKLIQEIDRNKLSLDKIDFGKRNLRRLAETPYVRLDSFSEAQHQNNKFVRTDAPTHDIPSNPASDGCEVDGVVCGSLDEWLHPLPSSEEMEIPRHMIPIYEKHKKLHAIEVKKVLKSFGQVLEGMFWTEDVQQGPVLGEHEKSVGAEVEVGVLKDPDVADEGQNVILSHGMMAALQGLALEFDDGPSMSLFKEGTEDFEWLNMDDNTARKYREENNGIETPIHASAGPTYDKTPKRATQGNSTKLPVQNDGDGPCFDTEPKLPRPTKIPRQSSPIAFVDPLVPPVSPELHDLLAKIVSDSSARVKHVKKAVKKRTAQPPVNAQRMKKIKIEPKDDALYQHPDFIEIEGFHTSLENFHASLKPRAEIDSDIMKLYLKTFNLEQIYNRKKPKKFAFSVFMGITNIKKVANCESAFKFDLNSFEIVTPDYQTQGTQ
ncbi:hypothetical protein ZWY2020_019507 [Hordeum vulgare]|nr:hypothetical protein ZWY2020_019507 [Hordeum vulgare]